MKKAQPLLPLFKQFIRDTQTGKRLKKNGEKIKKETVQNYKYALQNLIEFSVKENFELRICDASKLNNREFISEKNYWKKFYKKFTGFLYKNGCYDNYVGNTIKMVRVFFNYLKEEKNIHTGDFHKLFYVRKEEVDILVLSPNQLKFLIHDKGFEETLKPNLKTVKDIFVFGCTTGLRYSDIFKLTNKNFEKQEKDWYLKMKSQKTKTYSFIKLPEYAIAIYKKHKPKSNINPVFPHYSLSNFNDLLKTLGEKSNFTDPITVSREIQGQPKKINLKNSKEAVRFCDKMSSHMMRRTAITTLLILGMPEHLVRKVSGHSSNSTSFNRYVHYAQVYIDREIDKVHDKLGEY